MNPHNAFCHLLKLLEHGIMHARCKLLFFFLIEQILKRYWLDVRHSSKHFPSVDSMNSHTKQKQRLLLFHFAAYKTEA